MSDKIKVPKITDKTYYTLSQESYNRERLDDKLKTGKPIQTDQKLIGMSKKLKETLIRDLMPLFFLRVKKQKTASGSNLIAPKTLS